MKYFINIVKIILIISEYSYVKKYINFTTCNTYIYWGTKLRCSTLGIVP